MKTQGRKKAVLRYKENGLHIEAKGISGKEGIEILPSIPMEESDLIPRSFINYCWRTGESAVLDDAQKEARFNTDPYIRDNKTLSAMCLPIAVRGQVNGLLYLENSMLKGVFDKNRITLPQMLSGQIGISIENALLYENLEEKVAERTHEIEKHVTSSGQPRPSSYNRKKWRAWVNLPQALPMRSRTH